MVPQNLCAPISAEAMADGRLRLDSLITHRFPLDRVAEAVDLLVERPEAAVGVVLQPQAAPGGE